MRTMNRHFNKLPIAALITLAWAAQAQQVSYSPDMVKALVPSGQDVDMTFFQKGYDILPGAYSMSLQLNGLFFKDGKYELRELNGTLAPVFRVKDVRNWPLKDEVLKQLAGMSDETELFPLSKHLKDVRAKINTEQMTLD